MGPPRGMARVRREALAACMTCPLCRDLLREATAIAECLHTFCWNCIMKKINDEEADCCPVCNINLGCDPEEKLRPDHNLQYIMTKVFPIKRRKVDSPKVLPAKRKQRSLSSLVVDTPRVEIQTILTGKRTKTTRRRTTTCPTSPGNNGTMKLASKSESRDQKTEKISSLQPTKTATTANKKQRNTNVEAASKLSSEDRKNGKTTDKEELRKPFKHFGSSPEEIKRKFRELLPRKEDRGNKAVSSGTRVRTHSNKSRFEEENNGNSMESASLNEKTKTDDNLKQGSLGSASTGTLNCLIDAASKKKAPRSSPQTRSVEETKSRSRELLPRKEDTGNTAVSSVTRVRTHSNKSRFEEENSGNSPEPASLKEKTKTDDNLKQGSVRSASTNTLHDAITTPVWFSLVSSPNQKEDAQLPQLSKNYLRIKDGSLQICSVQRYISSKFGLASEDEVEITCHGETICPSTTLHGLMDLWLKTEPAEPVQASLDAPANEFVMALGYRRRPRAPAP